MSTNSRKKGKKKYMYKKASSSVSEFNAIKETESQDTQRSKGDSKLTENFTEKVETIETPKEGEEINLDETKRRIKNFEFSKERKRKIPDQEYNFLTKMFKVFDIDDSGEISSKEVQSALKEMGIELDIDEINKRIQAVDSNKNGTVSFPEFINLLSYHPQLEIFADQNLTNKKIEDLDQKLKIKQNQHSQKLLEQEKLKKKNLRKKNY